MKYKFLKISFWTLAIFAFILILPHNTLSKSRQSKIITYDINESGTAHVTYEISLQSEGAHSYISKYTLSTGQTSLANISAQLTSGRSLTHRVYDDNETKSIEVTFPQPARPQDDITWLLSYSSTEPVKTIGNVREISIPGFVGDTDVTVLIKVPQSFGSADYFSSSPTEEILEGDKRVFKFTDPKIKDSGILISIGEEQFYKFSYQYELENNDNTRMRATVALPPDYKNQEISFEKMEPTPTDSYRDIDGNYIAEYLINPGESYTVVIEGNAKIKNTLSNHFESPVLNLGNYLKPDTYWEVDNSEIRSLALELTNDKESSYEKAKAIYHYVASELTYNRGALDDSERQRLGAYAVFKNKENAICQEYSDLFVTLCRAAEIPARLLAGHTTAGIGYDLPQNTLHAWAEFYDEDKGWVTVDPTWESTSEGFNFFDNVGVNHFVLSIRGVSSTEPPLVLSFTPTDDVSDNLIIEPISASPDENEGEITMDFSMQERVITGIKNSGTIIISNNTSHVLSAININVAGEKVTVQIPKSNQDQVIFPGDQEEISISILPNELFKEDLDTLSIELTATLGENEVINLSESHSFNIEVNKILIYGFISLAAVTAVGVVVVGVAVVKRVKKRQGEKRKEHLM